MSAMIVEQLVLVEDDVAAETLVLPAPAIYVARAVYALPALCLVGFVVVDDAAAVAVVELLHSHFDAVAVLYLIVLFAALQHESVALAIVARSAQHVVLAAQAPV